MTMSSRIAGAGVRGQSPDKNSDPLVQNKDPEIGIIEETPVATGEDLRSRRKQRVDRDKEDEKEAYSSLMDLLDKVEERNIKREMSWIIFESVLISGLTAAMACTLTLERMKHNRFLHLRMWQYVMMAMVLFTGFSIIRFITGSILLGTRCWWRLRRNLGYFLKQIKTTVDVTIWLCAVLFAWYVWFRTRLRGVYGDVSIIAAHQITRFLIAACLGAVLWLGKDILFLWLEADLHYRQLCDRITRTTLQLHVLQILNNYGMWRFLTHTDDRCKIEKLIDLKLDRKKPAVGDKVQEDSNEEEKKLWMKGYNICKQLLLVNKETVPVLILKRLCKEYKNQIKLKPLPVTKEIIQNPEDLMEEASKLFNRMKTTNNNNADPSDDDEVKLVDLKGKYKDVEDEELELLFRKFRGKDCQDNHGNRHIEKKTKRSGFSNSSGRVCCCLANNEDKKESKNEHPSAVCAKENNPDDWRIGRDEFCSWAVQAYRNCWGLGNTLKSSEQIILKLNRMMVAFVLLLALIIWLLLSQIVDSGQIALLFSPLLAAKFIFSESTKNMFDGLIFALAMHPFNPGDRVIIQGMELLVTEINILSTIFYKYQTGEELVYPNSELATTQIINLEFIPDQSDKIEFTIPNTTPLEDIRDLEIKIQMSLDERKDAFNSKVVKTEMRYADILMTAHFNYVGSYLTSEVKAVHKSDMLSMIMRLVNKMKPKPSKNEVAPEPLPATCKPYMVEVTLDKKVKLKLVEEVVKVAIERAVSKHCKQRKYKVVMNSGKDRKVWIAFYVWNTFENPDEQQELISKDDLVLIQTCILGHIEHSHYQCKDHGEVGSDKPASSGIGVESSSIKPDIKVDVKIQPTPGVLDMTILKESNLTEKQIEVIKNTIKRNMYKLYYEDDFEVKINIVKKIVEIYAWRKFSHDIEKDTQLDMDHVLQHLDMQQILDKQLGSPSIKIRDIVSLKAREMTVPKE